MDKKKITICVLLYGDYFELAKRSIESITSYCDKDLYRLKVGLNNCCEKTKNYIVSIEEIDEIYISKKNINKCPMMKKMLQNISTEYVWWFDDDSHIIEKTALQKRLNLIEDDKRNNKNIVLWGHMFFFSHENEFNYNTDIIRWIKDQKWYGGKNPPCGVSSYIEGFNNEKEHRWFFITGGNWVAKTNFLKEIDWPPQNLIKRNDDVILSCAVRQCGYSMMDIGEMGVKINDAPRRGSGEDKKTMIKQIGYNL